MSDSKVSDLTACTDPTVDDELYLVDVSEAADADKSKKVTFTTLMSRIVVNDDEIVCNNDEIVIV